jgi:hypothetical protein
VKKILIYVTLLLLLGGIGQFLLKDDLRESEPSVEDIHKTEIVVSPDVEYKIAVSAEPVSAYRVKLTVNTNIPLPIEVAASVSINDQAPTETYIGVSKFFKLESAGQTFILDGTKERLPSGDYTTEVTFYPRWGAKNGSEEAKKIGEEISGAAKVTIVGSGETREQFEQRVTDQKWIMNDVNIGTVWNEEDFSYRLGKFIKSKADLNFNDAYYFPRADMTIIVNRLKNSVTIWRFGNVRK